MVLSHCFAFASKEKKRLLHAPAFKIVSLCKRKDVKSSNVVV